jgi:hypothetical protein
MLGAWSVQGVAPIEKITYLPLCSHWANGSFPTPPQQTVPGELDRVLLGTACVRLVDDTDLERAHLGIDATPGQVARRRSAVRECQRSSWRCTSTFLPTRNPTSIARTFVGQLYLLDLLPVAEMWPYAGHDMRAQEIDITSNVQVLTARDEWTGHVEVPVLPYYTAAPANPEMIAATPGDTQATPSAAEPGGPCSALIASPSRHACG